MTKVRSNDKRILLILTIAVAFIFLLLLYFRPLNRNQNLFSRDVSQCNLVKTELRFSCYRSVVEKYYKGNLSEFTIRLKDEKDLSFTATHENRSDISYAIFGTNCHTFYHAAGDFIATYSNEQVKTILDYGPTTCTNGYTMGVYKRLALRNRFETPLLKTFWEVCKEGAQNQCAHEIGHILHDKYSYAVLKVLDDISSRKYKLYYPESYHYVTFQAENPQANIDKAFEECRLLMPDKNKLAQCYTGIGHNLFLFAEFSKDAYKSVFSECAQAKAGNRNDCYAFLVYRIGINHAATEFLSHRFEEGRKVCNDVTTMAERAELKEHCYRGIGGGIGLFVDSEYALTEITEKNLASIKSQLLAYLTLCEESEEKYVNSCYAGLFGTRFAKFYDVLKIYHEKIEKLRPSWDSDFEVVG